MSSKFFNNKLENLSGSRGKQSKNNSQGSRTNNKRMNNGMKKSGRGR